MTRSLGLILLVSQLLPLSEALIPWGCTTNTALRLRLPPPVTRAGTALHAKKKTANAKLAALEALEALEENDVLDAPLSKKEQKALEKQKKKEEKAAEQAAKEAAQAASPKNAKAAALAALDALDDDVDQPLSKKELKALKKKQEKEAKAAAAADDDSSDQKPKTKKQKKAEAAVAAEEKLEEVVANGASPAEPAVAATDAPPAQEAAPQAKPTLEDKIRKDRPPPRIRVMESSQPGYTSLRLENVGITFRNQEVLKDVTWGVQTGDRIGLVGQVSFSFEFGTTLRWLIRYCYCHINLQHLIICLY